MNLELISKLEKVVELVDNLAVDPDIDIEYFIPGVSVNTDSHDSTDKPFILLKYCISEYTKPIRKIHLTNTYLSNPPELIVGLVTSAIQEFKMEIDSVEMG